MNKTTEALKLAEEAANRAITTLEYLKTIGVHSDSIDPTIRAEKKALAAIRSALADHIASTGKMVAEPVQEPVAHKWPLMGYGNVAIGGCKQPDGTSGLVYMDMGETREIDADTTDLFPVGSEADPSKLLACIYFKDGSAIQQTIDVLREMQIEIGYAAPVQPVKQEPMAWMYCPECGSLDVRYEDGNHKQCASCAQEWFSDIDYSDVVRQNLNRLHAAPVDAKAIRAEALDEAAKWFETNGANMMTKAECAAAIRGLK